jgi:hypothetical protein
MSQESLEAVRQVCAEWEQGNWGGPDLFDPEVEVVFSTTSFPDAGMYHGGRATLTPGGAGSTPGMSSAPRSRT